MSAAWGIRAEDLIEWSARYDAAAVLPDLVRRLLLATPHVETARIERLEMRSGAGVRLSGYDGVVVASEPTTFCPAGTSAWELSTETDLKKKASRDILKRERKSPAPIVPANTTYVVVTSRRFRDKHEWAREQDGRNAWRALWVLDADDLAMWLEQCPAVVQWFASEQLGRPVHGWSDLRSWVRRWEQRTQPPLPADLVLIDRQGEVEQLERWLERLHETSGACVRIAATRRDEACLFFAAVITSPDSQGGEHSEESRWGELESRTLVVETRDAWRAATTLDTAVPLILVPMFPEFDLGDRSARHATVVPVDASKRREGDLRIDEPLPWRMLVERLADLLDTKERAEQVARDSAGDLATLQRELGWNAEPAWVSSASTVELVAMLLMGAWEPQRPADQAVAEILGTSAAALEVMCAELATTSEQPIVQRGSAWAWRSHAEAWAFIGSRLSRSDLDRLRGVAKTVLGEDDPRYDLPKEERWYANVRGQVLSHSDALRSGLAETLVRMTIPGTSSRRDLVDWVVEELLGASWKRWASLGKLLPVLAEASPRGFLKAVRASLDTEQEVGVAQLLREEVPTGYSPHVDLIWALEILGWDRDLMPRVAHGLARLSHCDPGGRLANRPDKSLMALLHPITPQTLAPEEARNEILEQLVREYPDVGWTLLKGLLEAARGGRLPRSYSPRFSSWGVPVEPTIPPSSTVEERTSRLIDLFADAAGNDPDRWAEVINSRLDLKLSRSEFVTRLIERRPEIDDADAKIWSTLRSHLSEEREYQAARPEKHRHTEFADLLETAYNAYTPTDPLLRARPLFSPPFSLPDHHDQRTKAISVDDLQQEFLESIASLVDRNAMLERLLDAPNTDPRAIGRALAKSSFADDIEQELFDSAPSSPWSKALQGFVGWRRHATGFDWFADRARRLVSQRRFDEAVRAALALWPEPEVWDLVDELGEPVRSDYWRNIASVGEHDPPTRYDQALEHLIDVKNTTVALDLASHRAPDLPTELLLRTLELIVEPKDMEPSIPSPHELQEIFDVLWERDDIDINLSRTVHLESLLLTRYRTSSDPLPRFLDYLLRNSPAKFAEFVNHLYRPQNDEIDGEPSEPSEDDRVFAEWAYHVLTSWTYPGRDEEDPDARENTAFDWAEQALTLTHASGRGAVGEFEVAKVLTRVPDATDGHWPCLAARRLLETGKYPDLARGLAIAKMNEWTMEVRIMDAGEAHSELARAYSKSAVALSARWPRTADMLDGLAAWHRSRAENDAKRSRDDRLAFGHPRNPPPSPSLTPLPTRARPMNSSRTSTLSGLQCSAVGPAPSLSVDFAPRLDLITGDNGLGKTFLLDTAWWVLTNSWVKAPAMPLGSARETAANAEICMRMRGESLSPASFDPRRESWRRPKDWPETSALVIYAQADGGFSIWDPEPIIDDDHDDSPPPAAIHLSRDTLWDRLERDGTVLCNGLLTDWLQWQARHPELFERFFGIVRSLFAADASVEPGEPRTLGIRDAREIPTLRLPYGDVPITLLSAGMKRVLGLAYVVQWAFNLHVRARKQRTIDASYSVVFLFDEVEAHLHPRWQRALLPALLTQLEGLAEDVTVQLIATTHAPFVAASCETMFDEARDDLFVFSLSDREEIVIERIDWATHGDITNWVTSPVFGLERGRSIEAEHAIRAALAFMRGDATGDPALSNRDQIEARLREVLSDTDDFWPQWVVSVRDGAAQ